MALTFTLWPNLAPDPGGSLAAKLAVQSVDPGVTYYSYLTEYYPASLKPLVGSQASRARLKVGHVIFLVLEIQGKKHGSVKLKYVSYDSQSRLQIPGEEFQDEQFRPNTPNDRWIAPVFVTDPVLADGSAVKHFFVRLMLFDGAVLLASADTKSIAAGP